MHFSKDSLPSDWKATELCLQQRQDLAVQWLQDRDIDPQPIIERVGAIAVIGIAFDWTPDSERFDIYPIDYIGPTREAVAVPVIENGEIIDLLLVFDDFSGVTVFGSVWLGSDYLRESSVRLHAEPVKWLDAGCTGCCHVGLTSRKGLQELQPMQAIHCRNIETALEAWTWGFGEDDAKLAHFVIDASPMAIRRYYEKEARWRTRHVAEEIEGRDDDIRSRNHRAV
jgi:hypothetical protein